MVAVVMVYFWMNKNPGSYVGISGQPAGSDSGYNTNSSPNPIAKSSAKKSSATPTPLPSVYSNLVKEYGDRRIQFDDRCQAIPLNPTYKNGTSIMLDNRSNSARTIKIGNTSYSLSGSGYKIITLSSPSLPKELNVSCGSAGNVSKILLQAIIYQYYTEFKPKIKHPFRGVLVYLCLH